MTQIYDVIIIGGGPAGYTAGLYGVRAGLNVLLLEKVYAGGQIAVSHQVDNYPGFENGIDGFTLAQNMKNQAEKFGLISKFENVIEVNLSAELKLIKTDVNEYLAKTVIIATGASPRELGVTNEEKFLSKGVHYCASCDGMFYRGKTVAIIGGGDTALSDSIMLSRIAKKVFLIHRRDGCRGAKVYQDTISKTENIKVLLNSQVVELLGEEKLNGITVKNVKSGESTKIDCDAVFVCIGRKPSTEIFSVQIALNDGGYVIAGEDTKTNIEGVYAVGDVRTKALRQVVTAVSDGAVAIHYVENLLSNVGN